MSLTQYNYGAGNYAEFVSRCEKTGKGLIALSLTNYDNNNACEIAEGSVVEINGAIFRQESGNTAITGTPANNAINYIMLSTSGNNANASWNSTAPSWNTAYQGYYNGANLCIGGCYYDGANYWPKWIYRGRDTGPYIDYWHARAVSSDYVSAANTVLDYTGIAVVVPNETMIYDVNLPHGAVVLELQAATNATMGTNGGLYLKRGNFVGVGATNMASVILSGASSGNNNSIAYAVIDGANNCYGMWIINNTGGIISLYKMCIKYARINR